MMSTPDRGEVWLVRFDPAIGAEIQKIRPAVIANVSRVGRLPLCIVVPITDWKPQYLRFSWFTNLPAAPQNGLSKDSGADAFQVKSVSHDRLVRRLGTLTPQEMTEVAAAIALCVGYI